MALNINFDWNETKRNFILNISVMFLMFVSGIFMALLYFILNSVQNAFLSVDCLIPQNSFVSTCQEWFALAIYPILNLKYVLVFASYFFIFGLVFGLFYMGFRTRKHPALFVVHIITSLVTGYLSIEIANIYRGLLQNPQMYLMLTEFPIYNKIMLYFPQFMFFVIFLSGIIGFMGIFKSPGQFKEGVGDVNA